MPELTDDDFRKRPDPAKQLRLAAAGKIARGPGTVRHDAEHGRILTGPVAAVGKPLIEVFAEEAGAKPKKRRGMNRWEAEYASVLEDELHRCRIKWFAFEPIKLKLADGAYYKPDFCVVLFNGKIEFREVKGHWREASRVRIKVAARLFPWARFVAVMKRKQRDGGGWREEEF